VEAVVNRVAAARVANKVAAVVRRVAAARAAVDS
jgi:hypothetical protein